MSDIRSRLGFGLRSRWIPAVFLLGFLALWSRNLGYFALTGDEAFVAIMSQESVGEIFHRLNHDEPHPPLFYLFSRAWYLAAGGRSEFVARYPALLFGVITLSLTYRAGRDLGAGRWAASAAVLLAGLNPQFTAHVREARMYGPMLASLAGAAVVALHFERLGRRGWVMIAASLAALLTHYFNLFFVAALSLWGVVVFRGATRRNWIAAQAVSWALFAGWGLVGGHGFFNPTNLSQGKIWSFTLPPWQTLTRLAGAGAFGYRDYASQPWLSYLGGALLMGGGLAGGLLCRRKARWWLVLLITLPVVAYALIGAVRPVYHPKYMLPWVWFASLGLALWLARPAWPGRLAVLGMAALMLTPFVRTLQRPYESSTNVPPDSLLSNTPREVIRAMLQQAGPDDVLGMGTPDISYSYYATYYFNRDFVGALLPQSPTQTKAELENQLAALLDQHRVLWYLDYYNSYWDPGHFADEVFQQQALSLGSVSISGQPLRLYASADRIRREMMPLHVRFGQAAELEGLWLARGSVWRVVLVWRALADHPALDAKAFVHLEDSTGWVLSQADGVPVNWSRPLDTWRNGEQLLDVYQLPLEGDAANVVWLKVGLYDAVTLERLPATSAAGASLPDNAAAVALPLQ